MSSDLRDVQMQDVAHKARQQGLAIGVRNGLQQALEIVKEKSEGDNDFAAFLLKKAIAAAEEKMRDR